VGASGDADKLLMLVSNDPPAVAIADIRLRLTHSDEEVRWRWIRGLTTVGALTSLYGRIPRASRPEVPGNRSLPARRSFEQ
jgi:hypothetical protein